jgi:hypothetical protein
LGLIAFSRKRLATPHVLLILSWTVMALYSARNIPLYAVSIVPILVLVASDIINDIHASIIAKKFLEFQTRIMRIEQELKHGFWSVIALLFTLGLLLSGRKLDFQKQGNIFLEDVFPVRAVSWMEENMPQGNGFNHFPWGGYLLYRLWPEKLVFIDGQTDFYGEEITRTYEQIITMGEGWEMQLDQYSIQWVLVPSESELGQNLKEGREWKEVYKDNTAILLERK